MSEAPHDPAEAGQVVPPGESSGPDEDPAAQIEDGDLGDEGGDATDAAGAVRELTTSGWPDGYTYGATRHADVILAQVFSDRHRDLVQALSDYRPSLDELRQGGGGRTVFTRRFDESLAAMRQDDQIVWGKQNVTIRKTIELDGTTMRRSRTRGHEIDMFGIGHLHEPLPGIAVEMEWNNKDPFFDRDLINFQALHHEGAIAIGVIVTRGPSLQALIGPLIRSKDNGLKYGQSTTHWNKLIPKVNLGGGGECPLLLIGIEPARIDGIELAIEVSHALAELAEWEATERAGKAWRDRGETYKDFQAASKRRHDAIKARLPALREEAPEQSED